MYVEIQESIYGASHLVSSQNEPEVEEVNQHNKTFTMLIFIGSAGCLTMLTSTHALICTTVTMKY